MVEVDRYPCAITQSRLQDGEATYSPWFITDRVKFYLKLCEGQERKSMGNIQLQTDLAKQTQE